MRQLYCLEKAETAVYRLMHTEKYSNSKTIEKNLENQST